MNLLDAASLHQLSHTEKPARVKKNDMLASIDPEFRSLAKSKMFFAARVQTNQLAAPLKQTGLSLDGPIVVEINASQQGKVKNFIPKVIVISGLKKFQEACAQRMPRINVMIGSLAASALDIKADHELSATELRAKLQDAIDLRFGPNTHGFGGGQLVGAENNPWIIEVYPFEGYFTYSWRSKSYKMHFDINNFKRTVELIDTPQEITEGIVPVMGKSSIEAAAILHAHCGDVQAHDMEACSAKGGVIYSMADMNMKYKSAIKAGYAPKIKAKSPPGWEGTVKRMKNHPDIDNPWALAWWMDDEGYQPHK